MSTKKLISKEEERERDFEEEWCTPVAKKAQEYEGGIQIKPVDP